MKKVIKSQKAPAPLGPYNQAILSGNTLYLSGQVGIDPAKGEVVPGGVTREAEQVMKNLQAVLEEAGYSFQDVVKTSIFLKDMNDFTKVNEVYGSYFDEDTAPARETVEVANLPKFVHVEISMIAVK
ncbi:RidA family protein [Robertkochia aurantiaca]|uniref:RidA family protein n=1 Tax=Robertkochia aurantiaca TaxID=2873700 RepID=UPI001CCFEDEC|nr:RidA family protein [Robertkochia sp. 3YJGBD-33]